MIRLTLACLLALPALPAQAADAAYSRADLDGLFSGDFPLQLDGRGAIGPPPPLPPGVSVSPEASASHISAALDVYGKKPSEEQKLRLNDALGYVMSTGIGYDLCHYITVNDCDVATLTKNNIELRIKPLPNAYASTYVYTIGNKKVITVDPEMFAARYKPGDLASVLAHELSHVNDVTEFKSPLQEAKLATEKKAYLTGLQVYTELYHNFPSKISRDTEMHMMMLAWHRQVDKGRNFEKVSLHGTIWNLDKYIKQNFLQSGSPGEFVHAMARVFNPDMILINTSPFNMPISLALAEKQNKQIAEYLALRKRYKQDQDSYYSEPPLPPVLPNTGANPPASGGSDSGTDGSLHQGTGGNTNPGTGGGGIPFIPNPQFPPGTWPTTGQ